MMKKLLAALVVISIALLAFLGSFFISLHLGYETYSDVSYGEGACEKMDVYIPRTAYSNDLNGCVLFIHGGSWSGGDKREEELRARLVAKSGYIAVTMNYLLFGEENEDSYEVGLVLDEIDMALGAIKNFCSELGINVDKCAISGYSAGAHLSMLYSFSRANSAPIEIVFTANMAGPSDISSEIWGTDMARLIGERLTHNSISAEMMESGAADQILASISPVSYVNSSTPPSVFVYGGRDTTVSSRNGEALKEAFDAADVSYDYIFMPDSDHALIQNPLLHLKYLKTVLDYCEKYFN